MFCFGAIEKLNIIGSRSIVEGVFCVGFVGVYPRVDGQSRHPERLNLFDVATLCAKRFIFARESSS